MAGDWQKIPDGAGGHLELRILPNGDYEGRRTDSVRASVKAAHDMRQAVRGRGGVKQTEAGPIRLVASLPESVAAEMDQKCKGDPEKMSRFLADHPEHHVVDPGYTRFAQRKVTIYPGQKKRSR